jgi:hypothetical protein
LGSLVNLPWSIDHEFASLAREIPGFGGYFFSDEAHLSVYLTNPTRATQNLANTVLGRALSGRRFSLDRPSPREIVFLDGDYDFLELNRFRERLMPVAFGLSGVTMVDIGEDRNRVVIGVADLGYAARVASEIDRIGIPSDAVIIEQRPYVGQTRTLSDPAPTMEGGLQITMPERGPNAACTLGFNAYIETAGPYFVTNSHCTTAVGGPSSTRFYQGGSYIGSEVLDPPYFDYTVDGNCMPEARRCRYSDAALVRYWNQALVATRFGTIARPTALGSTTVDPNNQRWELKGKGSYPRFPHPTGGERVEKVGFVTGWTTGRVTDTCAHFSTTGVTYEGNIILLLCQSRAAGSGARMASGDSGSPVFAIYQCLWTYDVGGCGEVAADPRLYGVAWGGDATQILFSPMGGVERELGSLTVFGTKPPPPSEPCEPEPPAVSC